MSKKHEKLTIGEFAGRIYPIWADKMSGNMTVPFMVAAAFLAAIWKAEYDFFWIIFSLAVLVTSFKLVEEERDNLVALEDKIENKEVRQKAIDRLWELRSAGIGLRNQFPNTAIDYVMWESKFLEWCEKLLPEAGRVSPNLRQWLERLDILRPASVGISPQKQVQNMSEILARLGDFLKTEIYEGRILEYLVANADNADENPSLSILLRQDT